MLIDNDSLYLYNLTLKSPSSSSTSILGSFLGKKKSQELVLASSTFIELWTPDSKTGKIEKLCQQNVFGIIQSIDKLRVIGSQKDRLVVSSDSGKLVILEFDTDKLQFIPLIQEPHSKNGLRRITPGEYMAIDPQNRAIMISAIERNRLIYKVQSSADNKLELSSPLEASFKSTLTLDLVALDTGFENPMFAATECDYSEYTNEDGAPIYDPDSSPLLLNYYELDQGLNHVFKKKSKDKIPASSNHLIPLPGHIGGLLITCKSFIIYDHPNKERLYLPLPIRFGSNETIIVNYVLHKLKKNNFFVLIQSSLGDLFKITVEYDEDKEAIDNIRITYFDTIPLSNSLNILRSGFLFANVNNNNKLLYQFEKLGEDEDNNTLKSSDFPTKDSVDSLNTGTIIFKVKGLDNLALVDIIESLDPIFDGSLIETITPMSSDPLKQLLTLSSHSYLRCITHGVPTSKIVESPLPITPTEIYTTKLFFGSTNDEYLVISSSLSSRTLVLSIGEVVEEVEDSKFVIDQPTIAVQQVGKSSVIQIYANGIRHIRHIVDETKKNQKKATDWYPPAGISILKASTNNEQVIIGLSNHEICYFEVDPSDDQLIEYQERLEMSGTITSLALSKSQRKSSFAIIGCSDETIQVVSLQPHNCLEILTLQALSANSSSIVMLPHENSTLVHIGMENGLYVCSSIDEVTGKLSDTRIKYLGSQPVKLSIIRLADKNAILAISSRPWIGYHHKGNFKLTPLMDINITHGSSIMSEDIGGEGIVGLSGNSLVIFTVGNEEAGFNVNDELDISNIKLRYLPKNMIVDQDHSFIYIIESEYGIKGPFAKTDFGIQEVKQEVVDGDQDYYDAFGYEKSSDSWASCIQVVNFSNKEVVQTIELSNNEKAISVCKSQFSSTQDYLIIGITKDKRFLPNSFTNNYLYTFKILKNKTLEFVHKTDLDYPPTSIISFKGKILVGMSNYLRLYDLGQRQLLRKGSSNINYLNTIVKLVHQGGDRIVVGDSNNSTTFIKYDPIENQFIPFADDIMKRQITALLTLDHDTIIGGDKFGNLFVSRVPESISKQSNEDWCKYQESYLNGSGSRVKNICEFYLQDIPTSFTKGSLIMGGKESIIYTGLQGTLGILLPISTKQEVEFLTKLELLLRKCFDFNFDDFKKDKNGYNLLGKDHLKFRSYYNPVKNVIDGDLIERFYELNASIKIKIGNELDRTPKEIERKISELRSRSAF